MTKFKLLFSLLNKREKKQLLLIFIVLFMMGLMELIGVGSISPFITIVSNPEIIHANEYLNKIYALFDFSSDNQFIMAFGVLVIGVIGFSNLFLAGCCFINNYYVGKRFHSIAMRLLDKYLRQPYVFYLTANTADLSKNILSDVSTYVNRVLLAVLHFITSAIISFFIIFLLIMMNPGLALVVSVTLGLSYFIVFTFVRKSLAKKGNERAVYNTLKYKYINEAFGGVKDIKILGKEKVFLDFFSVPSKKFALNDAASEVINEIPKYLLETIAFGGILGVIIFMIHSGERIEDFLPVLSVYAFGAYRLLPSLQKIFRAVTSVKYNFPIVKVLNRDFNGLPEGMALAGADIEKMPFHKTIALENIIFAYPGHKPVIKNQSLLINANTSIALVGSTGCGKTTLVDIILGLLEPQSGKIMVDGAGISGENRRSWQKNLGYVPQSIYLPDDTIRANIAFGIAPEKIDDQAVIKAARLANIHDFIAGELERGYDTTVGERGIRLSGGQRQRIGIARAVYHDPSVLILDEATSALDSLTENAIMEAINNLSHKKTIIMIAHRLTTVKHCDVIYLMEKGVITDHGTFEELYARNGSFKKMADGI
jgi:ABC-type multidrug transport system fused ATPase/permease subunit